FFFQAEDGIRDRNVTGVQTCALPILGGRSQELDPRRNGGLPVTQLLAGRLMTLPPFTRVPERFVRECARALRKVADAAAAAGGQIGRASCRERGERSEGAGRCGGRM